MIQGYGSGLVSSEELIPIRLQGTVISIWSGGSHGSAPRFDDVWPQGLKDFKEDLPVWTVGIHDRRLLQRGSKIVPTPSLGFK